VILFIISDYSRVVTIESFKRRFWDLTMKMKIAIVGDIHGDLKQMYDAVSYTGADFILQLGDFHAIRDEADLNRFPIPQKHRKLGDFPDFYNKGEVPIPTFFISGNHDNAYWHSEHPEGKELITNLNYLGRSGVGEFGGLKVGWVSGNYSPKGFEGSKKPPKYNHFTKEDVKKLIALKEGVDVLLFHDWPSIQDLEKKVVEGSVSNPEVFQQTVRRNLGSHELYDVVEEIKPSYVFAGHVHMPLDLKADFDGSQTRFVALGKHSIHILDTKALD